MMSTDATKYVLIVEDEEKVRRLVRTALSEQRDWRNWKYLEAEHMKQAEALAKEHWHEIVLIIMDVMLPKGESDAEKIKSLIREREPKYDRWLELEDAGSSRTDAQWLEARFAVDAFDRQTFAILNVQGGIELVENWAKTYGHDGKLDRPVLYLTARENEVVTEEGMALVVSGKAEWRVKPVTREQVLSAVRQILS